MIQSDLMNFRRVRRCYDSVFERFIEDPELQKVLILKNLRVGYVRSLKRLVNVISKELEIDLDTNEKKRLSRIIRIRLGILEYEKIVVYEDGGWKLNEG